MSLLLPHLDQRTRDLMLEEVDYDTERQQLHISPYLSGQGQHDYEQLLRQAIENGDETTLAAQLAERRRIARTAHRRKPGGGYNIVTVPQKASSTATTSAPFAAARCKMALNNWSSIAPSRCASRAPNRKIWSKAR